MRFLEVRIEKDELDYKSIYVKTNLVSDKELTIFLVNEEILSEDEVSQIIDIEEVDSDIGEEFKEVISDAGRIK